MRIDWTDPDTVRLPACDRHRGRHRWWCPACDFETEEQVQELCAKRRRLGPELELLREAVAVLIAEAENPWPVDSDIGAAVERALDREHRGSVGPYCICGTGQNPLTRDDCPVHGVAAGRYVRRHSP